MSPSGGDTTVVLQPITWSPGNSTPSSANAQHMWFEVWPGVCTPVIVHPGPDAARSPSATRWSGWNARSIDSSSLTPSAISSSSSAASAGSGGGCGPKAYVGAPVSARSHAASGEWSAWQWVTRIAVTVSPASAACRASRWVPMSGPGSTTATWPSPTM